VAESVALDGDISLAETSVKRVCSRAAGLVSWRNGRETCPKPGRGRQEVFVMDTEVAGRFELPGTPRITVL